MNKMHAVFSRFPLPLRAFFVIWAVLSFVVSSIDELHEDLSWWMWLALGLPYAMLSVYFAIYTDVLGIKSLSSLVPRNKKPEVDPVALYETGRISHHEMMERIDQRNLSDIMGFRLIVIFVGVLFILVLGIFPTNSDNSVKAIVLTPAVAILGFISTYVLWRGVISRPLRWASYLFIAIALIQVPIGIIAILQG